MNQDGRTRQSDNVLPKLDLWRNDRTANAVWTIKLFTFDNFSSLSFSPIFYPLFQS